jgi:spherulation-specific family 4 protein
MLSDKESHSRVRTVVATSVAAATALFFILGAASQTQQVYALSGHGLIIPVYGYDADWSAIEKAKSDNPGDSILAVISPSDGPGDGQDSHWSNVVNELQDAGVKVLGYIDTHYAGDSKSSVNSQIDDYYNWYGVNGVFLDEVSDNDAGYYKSLYNHGGDKGLVVLNPGAPVPHSYSGAADVIIASENTDFPSHVTTNGIASSKLGVLEHGGDPSKSDFARMRDQVGYVYGSPDWTDVASNLSDQADWAS